jgi:hypothetical protein
MPLHFLVTLKLTLQLSCNNSSNFLQWTLRTRCWISNTGLELKQGFVDLEYSEAKQNFIDRLYMYETNHRVPNLSHFHL